MNDTKPSKSARKREYLGLQELGEQLLVMSTEQLDQVDLGEDLRIAVLEAKSMRSHGALRRQKQLIGKLMRHVDPEPIRIALNDFNRQDRADRAVFQRAEAWRDRIIADGGTAIAAFADDVGCDTMQLLAFHEQLNRTSYPAGQKKLRRQIFREVHQQLTSMVQKATD